MVGERLLKRAKEMGIPLSGSETVPIQLSVGCSTLVPLPGGPNFNLLRADSVERAATELVAAADASLYGAKHSGEVGVSNAIDWSVAMPAEAAA